MCDNSNDTLKIGSRVHCILYGGKDGVVFNIRGEQSPASCGTMGGGIVVTGGSANFDIVWDNGTESLGIPESLIRRSVQWEILVGVADAEEIETLRAAAVSETQRRKDEADRANAAYAAEVARLKSDPAYAHLVQGSDDSSGLLAAKNIRIELKRAFPAVKFSVRKLHYGSLSVSWIDGPRGKDVDAIVSKYKSSTFDGMIDLESSAVGPWNTVFGGSKYLSLSRELSPDAYKKAALEVAHDCDLPLLKVSEMNGHGYISSGEGDYRVPFTVFERDNKLLIASDSHNGEWYSHLVRDYAFRMELL